MHVAVALSCCAIVARIGSHVIDRARAQSAADSVALAIVMQDVATARKIAAALGARIVTVSDDGPTASVLVEVSGQTRSATAIRAVQSENGSLG